MSESPLLVSLPTDIHFCILHYIPNLSSLQSTILTHPSLYNTYLTYRTQILKSVFLNQIYANDTASDSKTDAPSRDSWAWKNACDIISKLPVSKDRLDQPSNQNLGIPKGISAHPDSEIFHSAFWPTISKTLPSAVALRWGKELATCYAHNNKLHEALKIALQLWTSISKLLEKFRRKKAQDSNSTKVYVDIKRHQQECINLLISIYRFLLLNDEAIDLQRQVLTYLSPHKSIHASYSQSLSQTLQSLGRTEELITFQKQTWELYCNAQGPTQSLTLDWARHLLLTYNANGLIQESLDFQMQVLNGLNRGSMGYISWSRGLINAYRKVQSSLTTSTSTSTSIPAATSINIDIPSAILNLALQTFQSYPPASPGYFGWSRDLCKILRSQNKDEEALAIEVQAWEETRRRKRARPADKGLAYRARGPGLVVAASYRRLGKIDMAAEVERECGEGDIRFK